MHVLVCYNFIRMCSSHRCASDRQYATARMTSPTTSPLSRPIKLQLVCPRSMGRSRSPGFVATALIHACLVACGTSAIGKGGSTDDRRRFTTAFVAIWVATTYRMMASTLSTMTTDQHPPSAPPRHDISRPISKGQMVENQLQPLQEATGRLGRAVVAIRGRSRIGRQRPSEAEEDSILTRME
jgi:hypothetical protein